MPAGRPRTVSLSKEEMIDLGKEMVNWVEEHKPLHLSKWYSIHKMFTYNEWDAMTRIPEFLPYYEKALSLVKEKYIDGTIAPAIANRFLRRYYKEVKDEEDEELQTKLDKELIHKKALIDHEKTKTDIPPLSDKVDEENKQMKENYLLRKENEELKAKIANQSETRSELC